MFLGILYLAFLKFFMDEKTLPAICSTAVFWYQPGPGVFPKKRWGEGGEQQLHRFY